MRAVRSGALRHTLIRGGPDGRCIGGRARVPLVAGLFLLAACEGRLGWRIHEAVRGSFPLPAGTKTLRVHVPEGDLTFLPGKDGEATFEGATLRAADTEAQLALLAALRFTLVSKEAEPGVVALEAPDLPVGADPRQCKLVMKATFEVPHGIAIEAETGNGSVGARGLLAPLCLATQHGDVIVIGCHGDAVLRGSGGKTIIDQHRGSLDVEASEFVVQLFVHEIGAGGIRVVNRRGGIQAHVPHDARFDLDLIAHQGHGANSFGIPGDAYESTTAHASGSRKVIGVRMRGPVSGGGPKVHLESRAEGSVSLQGKVFAR